MRSDRDMTTAATPAGQGDSTDFTISGTWSGTMSEGRGELGGSGLHVTHSVPVDLGGRGSGTNPEELLTAAAASCAIITLTAILEAQAGTPVQMQCVTTAGFKSARSGPVPVGIAHEIRLISHVAGLDTERTAGLVERNCMISRALAGNVPVTVKVTNAANPEPV
jgi:peroxiredoxin-like protein